MAAEEASRCRIDVLGGWVPAGRVCAPTWLLMYIDLKD
jgi:hypothetical protein